MFKLIYSLSVFLVFVGANPVTKIINGNEVEPNSIPYQAGIFFKHPNNKTTFCGGALISKNVVLTAAHCTNGTLGAEVVLGAHNIWEQETTQVRITVNSSDFITHELYKVGINDIALINLPEPVQLTSAIKTINLPSHQQQNDSFVNQPALLSGWGLTSDNATTISSNLYSANTFIMDNRLCGLAYLGLITDSHICSDSTGIQGSACDGDSGGPLVVDDMLVGIVSFGSAFGCENQWAIVYTRITSYSDWINKNSGNIF